MKNTYITKFRLSAAHGPISQILTWYKSLFGDSCITVNHIGALFKDLVTEDYLIGINSSCSRPLLRGSGNTNQKNKKKNCAFFAVDDITPRNIIKYGI